MKSLNKIAFLGVAVALGLSACTVEKRVSMPGYHVEWNKNRNTVHNDASAVKKEDKKIKSNEQTAFAQVEREEATAVEETSLAVASIENTAKIALDEKVDAAENNRIAPSKTAVTTVKDNNEKVSVKQIVQAKKAVNKVKHEMKKNNSAGDVDIVLLYILCFLLPPIAVGLATDWETNPLILNIILTLLCGIPGIIHAIIVVSKSR